MPLKLYRPPGASLMRPAAIAWIVFAAAVLLCGGAAMVYAVLHPSCVEEEC